ncbi:AAA family ATPase [Mycolicibacterium novocastrense]|nr:AAA family ATPase [Mycolicibacterium novocastrense]
MANIPGRLRRHCRTQTRRDVAQGLRRRVRGQSAVKTAKTIDQALGGVLFIDEAYALVQERDGRTDPFGQEALDTLLARMENDRDRLVVIIAGYSSDIDRLLETNEGLRSRFATRIEFDTYSPEELLEIANVIAAADDSALTAEAAENFLQAAKQLEQRMLRGRRALDVAGSGRYARQLVEASEQCRDMRLAQGPRYRHPRRRPASRDQRLRYGGGYRRGARTPQHERMNYGASPHHQGSG